jgi:3-deoxy-D-manno-octulosonic-acid transferase
MSALIYRLAIGLYALAVRFASLFNKKAGLFISGRKGLLSKIRYALIDERRPRIWMHCASLGEFEQGRPVLEQLRKDHPGSAIVLTFFSPSGYEVRKDYKGADYVFYLPIDTRRNAKQFIALVQPQLCIFVKYEFWYFLLKEIESKNITSILISAIFRKEQVFFKWYGGLHRRMLYSFSKIFLQDEVSAQLLQKIGIDDAVVAGDTRFDRVVAAVNLNPDLPVADAFTGGSKILIAGSTWPEDEKFLRTVLDALPEDWKMVIAPHEVDDAHIQQLQQIFGHAAITWSAWKGDTSARVLIVDRIGLLLQLYSYGTVAWIGGGFGKGIHNTLEAAVYGLPVGFGLEYEKFREAKELIACGGAFSTAEPAYLVNMIANWDKDPSSMEQAANAARKYVLSNAGATETIVSYLAEKKLWSTS